MIGKVVPSVVHPTVVIVFAKLAMYFGYKRILARTLMRVYIGHTNA